MKINPCTLSTKNLTLSISNKQLCHKLNIQFQPGEMWAILGKNGAGKSTLLHTLAGLNTAYHPVLFLNQQNFSNFSAKQRAQAIGLLLQEHEPALPDSVFAMVLAARYVEQSNWLTYSATDKNTTMNNLKKLQLETLKDRLVPSLSSGERQRAYIARILCQQPFIYLLDEPLNHLDIAQQVGVLNLFRELVQYEHQTVIMSCHDINLAVQYCDRVLMLFEDGSWLKGLTEELMTEENLSRLYHQEFLPINYQEKTIWIIKN